MIKRSVVSGITAGLLLCLVSLFPIFSVYLFPQVLQMPPWPAWSPLLRAVALMLNGFVGFGVFLLIGGMAALRSRVTNALHGFKSGAISGVAACLVFYILILSPTTSFAATVQVWAKMPLSLAETPADVLVDYLSQLTWGLLNEVTICVLTGLIVGGIEGALVGWLLRYKTTLPPLLLDVLDQPQSRQRWFEKNDDVWRAGVLAGLIGGVVLAFGMTIGFVNDMEMQWPRVQLLFTERGGVVSQVLFSKPMVGLLSPFVLLMMIGAGALAIVLLPDPPRRFWSRFKAVIISGMVASVPIYLSVTRVIYFNVGLARHFVNELLTQSPDLDINTLTRLYQFAHAPVLSLPIFFIVPFFLFSGVMLAVTLWMIPQAVLYSLTLPIFIRRPADRAARLAYALNQDPAALLPRLYGLYKQDAQAVQVLPHLTFALPQPDAARVVAAFHTLQYDYGMGHAVPIIRQVVQEREEWRWRVEVGALYRILEQGLAAQTLEQVRRIQPPPEQVTSSLPPVLAKSCEGIGRILVELHKVNRVDDLNTKLIFLNSAQAALLDLRRYLTDKHDDPDAPLSPFPEVRVLHMVLDRWQSLILNATHELQGRADLQSSLQIRQADMAERVQQVFVIANQGLNVAQHVRLYVHDQDEYTVVDGNEQEIDILGPQESHSLEVWLRPVGAQRIRLVWHLTFDDAVTQDRYVEFADVMELVAVAEQAANARPFQRIFPIPYVTGTPLRSSEMFVGRQDVFDFVRENLLGAYQNNVIVLHGQRRTGKTSVLYRLQQVLQDTHIAVLVDMQGKAARGAADFLYALSDDIAYTLENNDVMVELPDRPEYEQSPEFAFRSRFLRSAIAQMDNGHARQRNLLLMFDEFEELQKRVQDGKLDPEIFTFLRNLMQHEPRVDFIFSGTHKLEELGADYWSILFNIAAYKKITFLSPEDTRRLIAGPVAAYGMDYDPLALERIVQVTAGHPYFTQVVCHELVSYHNETQRNYITTACVDKALEQILERGEAHFKYIWTEAGREEQLALLTLADLLPDSEMTATTEQVAAGLERRGQAVVWERLLEALTRLQGRDILTRAGPQSTLFKFKIDLIRRWILATRPMVGAAA